MTLGDDEGRKSASSKGSCGRALRHHPESPATGRLLDFLAHPFTFFLFKT